MYGIYIIKVLDLICCCCYGNNVVGLMLWLLLLLVAVVVMVWVVGWFLLTRWCSEATQNDPTRSHCPGDNNTIVIEAEREGSERLLTSDGC